MVDGFRISPPIWQAGSLKLKCYAKGDLPNCEGYEFLYDFSALIIDDALLPEDRFLSQVAVAGEIEWSLVQDDIAWDFHKLLFTDAILCFMVFSAYPEEKDQTFAWLSRAVRNHQRAGHRRGHIEPPAFLLSCIYGARTDYRFDHRLLLPAPKAV